MSRNQRAGKTYEKRVGEELQRRIDSGALEGLLYSGSWIEFLDANGHGFAQPDYFLVTDGVTLVFECKLSQRDAALVQVGRLYRPLLRELFKQPVVGIQVCKILRKESNWFVDDPSKLMAYRKEHIFTWHWIG